MVAENPCLGIGDPKEVANGAIKVEVIQGAKMAIKKLLEDAIDRMLSSLIRPPFLMNRLGMKTTPEPATVLLVGGGSVIAPTELDGVGGEHHRQWLHKIKTEIQLELIRPPFFSCANAVGACVANVAGEIGELFPSLIIARVNLNNIHNLTDTIEILKDLDLSMVLERCKAEAMKRAVQAGAKPDTVKVVEIENLPVQVSRFHFQCRFAVHD